MKTEEHTDEYNDGYTQQQNNEFDAIIRQTLQSHEFVYEPDDWLGMEEKLDGVKPKPIAKRTFWYNVWLPRLAAAMLTIGLVYGGLEWGTWKNSIETSPSIAVLHNIKKQEAVATPDLKVEKEQQATQQADAETTIVQEKSFIDNKIKLPILESKKERQAVSKIFKTVANRSSGLIVETEKEENKVIVKQEIKMMPHLAMPQNITPKIAYIKSNKSSQSIEKHDSQAFTKYKKARNIDKNFTQNLATNTKRVEESKIVNKIGKEKQVKFPRQDVSHLGNISVTTILLNNEEKAFESNSKLLVNQPVEPFTESFDKHTLVGFHIGMGSYVTQFGQEITPSFSASLNLEKRFHPKWAWQTGLTYTQANFKNTFNYNDIPSIAYFDLSARNNAKLSMLELPILSKYYIDFPKTDKWKAHLTWGLALYMPIIQNYQQQEYGTVPVEIANSDIGGDNNNTFIPELEDVNGQIAVNRAFEDISRKVYMDMLQFQAGLSYQLSDRWQLSFNTKLKTTLGRHHLSYFSGGQTLDWRKKRFYAMGMQVGVNCRL